MRRAYVQVNQQQQCDKEWDRQVSEHTNNNVYTIHKNNVVTIEFSRKRENERSTSRTFVRLFV